MMGVEHDRVVFNSHLHHTLPLLLNRARGVQDDPTGPPSPIKHPIHHPSAPQQSARGRLGLLMPPSHPSAPQTSARAPIRPSAPSNTPHQPLRSSIEREGSDSTPSPSTSTSNAPSRPIQVHPRP